jgi:O-antigen ligase
MAHHARLSLVPAFLGLCLLLGGASAAGSWANLGLQIAAVAIIAWGLLSERSTGISAAGRQLVILFALLIALLALQLVPLPPDLWTALPGRERIASVFRLAELPLPWMPLSLAPYETLSAALWLLPAAAILIAIFRLGAFKANYIAWTVIVVTALSVLMGALQISGPERSPWYLYEITNFGQTTGFFANSNHLGTLLVITIPLLAALYLQGRSKQRSAKGASGMMIIVAGALAVVVVGLVTNHSLAAIGLAVPVGGASALMMKMKGKAAGKLTGLAMLALTAAAVAASLSAPFGNNLTTDEARASPGSRFMSFSISMEVAKEFFPVGAGIGTFTEVYPLHENHETLDVEHMNHAHNDYLEVLIEAGAAGALLFLAFAIWWMRRTVSIWASADADDFSRAASIASAAILAHSFVDYPLRTAAISALFAALCALMAEPRPRGRAKTAAAASSKARHLTV